jgi:hypothetical protein
MSRSWVWAVCGHCDERIHDCPPRSHRGSDATSKQCRGWVHESGWHWCDPNLTACRRREVAEPQLALEDTSKVLRRLPEASWRLAWARVIGAARPSVTVTRARTRHHAIRHAMDSGYRLTPATYNRLLRGEGGDLR